jgi:hypothetical protein
VPEQVGTHHLPVADNVERFLKSLPKGVTLKPVEPLSPPLHSPVDFALVVNVADEAGKTQITKELQSDDVLPLFGSESGRGPLTFNPSLCQRLNLKRVERLFSGIPTPYDIH